MKLTFLNISCALLTLSGCTVVDNQQDIDAGTSNQIAQSPCVKEAMEPFYVQGIWIKPLPLMKEF